MHANIENTYIDRSNGQSLHYIDAGLLDYDKVLKIQNDLFNSLLADYENSTDNYILFCEHNPVYTLGKSGKMENLLINDPVVKVERIERGGDITFHGPGQLVGYPILNLAKFKLGLRSYVELIELSIMELLEKYGLKGERSGKETGVWLDVNKNEKRKICSIGIKSSKFIVMHGFALNITTDLHYFERINPCGFKNTRVTSLAEETGIKVKMDEIKELLLSIMIRNLSPNFRLAYDNIAHK